MKTNLFDAKLTVLHFAPEFIFEKYLRKNSNLTYTTADISQAKADVAMDITDIKFGDNSFDVILCNDVLEHVEDDKKALLELYRVLKKESGWAVLQVPIDINRTTTFEDFAITSHREREKHFGRHDHVRVYGKDYEDRLKAAGFKVDVIDFKNEFSGEEIAKYNLNTDRKIYFCQKK